MGDALDSKMGEGCCRVQVGHWSGLTKALPVESGECTEKYLRGKNKSKIKVAHKDPCRISRYAVTSGLFDSKASKI